jgi:cob(I)alamin adenosyltransferase
MIYLFTGDGKGKTTAALGTALRAVGASKKILFIQFLKTPNSSENNSVKEIKGFDIKSFGRSGFFLPKEILKDNPSIKGFGIKPFTKKDKYLAKEGLEFFKENFKDYDLFVLDEICCVLNFGLVNKLNFLRLIKERGCQKDIILTGRNCPKEIEKFSDLVTEMKNVKHYYQKGQKAKKGIDF